jgi:hypothetical protein
MGMKVVDNVTAYFEGRDEPDRVVQRLEHDAVKCERFSADIMP